MGFEVGDIVEYVHSRYLPRYIVEHAGDERSVVSRIGTQKEMTFYNHNLRLVESSKKKFHSGVCSFKRFID